MWHDLALPWRACLEEAWAAYRAGSLPIGAAIVAADGRILARGRNRLFDTQGEGAALYGRRLAHAEINALTALDAAAGPPQSCTLYTTTEPCPQCIGAIRMALLGEVRYASRDAVGGSVALLQATPFMRRRPVRAVGPSNADLEALIIALFVARALELADPARWVIDEWRADVPHGVAVGELLYRDGTLRRLRDDGASVAQVVDCLATAVRR